MEISNHIYSFEKLNVWQDARLLVTKIYQITNSFPKEEKYSLTDQLRRASISIVSNIAEGTSRTSNKDKAHFTQIAYGSLMEVLSQLYIANDLLFINQEQLLELKSIIYKLSNQLNALRKSQLNSSTSKQLNN